MNFLELMDYVVKNGGATLEVVKSDNYKIIEKNSGYIVGLDSEKKFNLKTDFDKIVKYFMEKNDNVIMGLWLNDGVLYVDENIFFTEDLEIALMIGKEHNQKAIFSCADGKDIYL